MRADTCTSTTITGSAISVNGATQFTSGSNGLLAIAVTPEALIAAADTAGRFEVSPVLRQLFDADEVALVEAEYQRLLDAGSDQDSDTEADDE